MVPAAVGLRTRVSGEPSNWRRVTAYSARAFPYVGTRVRPGAKVETGKAWEEFDIDQIEFTGEWSDYVKACVRVLLDHGCRIKGGSIEVKSDIPIASGLASSAALEVSTLGWFNLAYRLGLSRERIAELAYEAEHDILGIPCGRLDQYSSSFGWIVKLETRPPYRVEELPIRGLVFVGADSGIQKSTAQVHPQRQKEIDDGLKALMESPRVPLRIKRELGYRYNEPDWSGLSESELDPYLSSLPEDSAERIRFTLRMNESTHAALKLLRGERLSGRDEGRFPRGKRPAVKRLIVGGKTLETLGLIMNVQHEFLRDLYDVSLPQLERMRGAMLKAGALGVKLTGAGLGGSLVALVRDEGQGRKVLDSALNAGACRGWVLGLDEGVRSEG